MRAIFYNQQGKAVWTCIKDARFELSNGTRAIEKGAIRGELIEDGQVIDQVYYAPFL
jgi:hypothetical protein